MSRKIAALDLGSNSFHLAFAERLSPRSFSLDTASKEKVQLGQSAFETGIIDADAFARGLAAIRKQRKLIESERPEIVLAVATSALREAVNGHEFVQKASAIGGFPIRVISGDEEARLVCLGTLRTENLGHQRTAIVDLGGGSTEIIVAEPHACHFATSLALGTLRLRSDWQCSALPTRRELDLLAQRVQRTLEPALRRVAPLAPDAVVLSCGSARRLVRLARVLDDARGDEARLTLVELTRLKEKLGSLTQAKRAALVGEDPARADTLLVASVVFEALFVRLRITEAHVSSAGLREGLVADYLTRRAAAPAQHALAV